MKTCLNGSIVSVKYLFDYLSKLLIWAWRLSFFGWQIPGTDSLHLFTSKTPIWKRYNNPGYRTNINCWVNLHFLGIFRVFSGTLLKIAISLMPAGFGSGKICFWNPEMIPFQMIYVRKCFNSGLGTFHF